VGCYAVQGLAASGATVCHPDYESTDFKAALNRLIKDLWKDLRRDPETIKTGDQITTDSHPR
jgi:hypothetical protein